MAKGLDTSHVVSTIVISAIVVIVMVKTGIVQKL